MSSKIEFTREFVERQPVDAILLENCEEVTVQDYGRGYFATDDCVAQLYTAPPELAELQATIARLTAENQRLQSLAYIGEHQFEDLTWKSRCTELRAEIERLKGGQK